MNLSNLSLSVTYETLGKMFNLPDTARVVSVTEGEGGNFVRFKLVVLGDINGDGQQDVTELKDVGDFVRQLQNGVALPPAKGQAEAVQVENVKAEAAPAEEPTCQGGCSCKCCG